jgi:hypothetical protein
LPTTLSISLSKRSTKRRMPSWATKALPASEIALHSLASARTAFSSSS